MLIRASVVIVSRGKPELLSRAIDSVINQDFPAKDFEIILVDDGSQKDDLAALVKKKAKTFPAISCVRQGPLGLSAGRNTGAKNARGEIIVFTDNDCIADPQWLKNMVSKFTDGNVAGVEGKIIPAAPGENISPRKLFTNAPENLSGGKFTGANTAYRKEIILKAGGYDEVMNFWREDSEFAFRAMEFGKIAFAKGAIIFHPPRPEKKLNALRYLSFLRNEFICFLRHPVNYKKYIGFVHFARDFGYSFFVLLAFYYVLFLPVPYPLQLQIILKSFLLSIVPPILYSCIFSVAVFGKKISFDFHSLSDWIDGVSYSYLGFAKYVLYLPFALIGFILAIPLINSWPKGEPG
ncbi:MAG TPA: glycosyltransferase family 2 protein [Candidatus Diapherotrites archaeon]|uniref:Glycosyltransferase family 2 protein n=1 Tax=Candidatus Iainarchaeum sp. TaxID=3101447 RepID=A0A7J4IZ87_9ARCH|nr:glycosyltransferase family 2 protein [Candidatus Diapherotrites archaeon]